MVDVHESNIPKTWTPIFERYKVRCGSWNGQQKGTSLEESGRLAPIILTILGSLINMIRAPGWPTDDNEEDIQKLWGKWLRSRFRSAIRLARLHVSYATRNGCRERIKYRVAQVCLRDRNELTSFSAGLPGTGSSASFVLARSGRLAEQSMSSITITDRFVVWIKSFRNSTFDFTSVSSKS